MLASLRCADGGWNYGSPRALHVALPSYIETTALALVGLQDQAPPDALEYAQRRCSAGHASPLASAWMKIALRLAGVPVPESPVEVEEADVMLAALGAMGDPEGNWRLLSRGAPQ